MLCDNPIRRTPAPPRVYGYLRSRRDQVRLKELSCVNSTPEETKTTFLQSKATVNFRICWYICWYKISVREGCLEFQLLTLMVRVFFWHHSLPPDSSGGREQSAMYFIRRYRHRGRSGDFRSIPFRTRSAPVRDKCWGSM